MSAPLSLQVPGAARGQRLDKFLSAELAARGFSRSRLQRLLERGALKVDGQQRPARYALRGGERLELELPAEAPGPGLKPADLALDLLYEDEDLLVVNKPAGLVTHPGAGHADDTLANALLHHCGPSLKPIGGSLRPGIVHRLDKDTSGCLVAAKSEAAFAALQAMIAAREVKRLYLALAWGDFAEASGSIEAPLGRGPDRQKMAVRSRGGKPALTHFQVRERFAGACELECRLETGRTHQIRVHLQSIGHGVVGDAAYGRSPAHLDPALRAGLDAVLRRQALHAWKLEFRHPLSGRMLRAKAPEPADYKAARKLLKASA